MNSVLLQIKNFCAIMGMGIILGLILHFYWRMLSQMRVGKKVAVLFDFLLWIGLIAVVFAALIKVNLGEVRSYVWISLFAGLIVYYQALAPKTKGLVNHLADRVALASRKSFKTIIIPLHKLRIRLKRFRIKKEHPPENRE